MNKIFIQIYPTQEIRFIKLFNSDTHCTFFKYDDMNHEYWWREQNDHLFFDPAFKNRIFELEDLDPIFYPQIINLIFRSRRH